MAKGKNRQYAPGIQGVVQSQTGPDWGYLYRASAVKDDKYNIGDKVELPDGRTFRYGKSGGACSTGQAVDFRAGAVHATAGAVSTAIVVGTNDSTVVVDAKTHSAIAVDALRGGYVQIAGTDNSDIQFRGIVGNVASAANAAITLYLDAPVAIAVAAAEDIDIFYNPWSDLRLATSAIYTKAGTPTVEISAADVYFWVQVDGPCWNAPNAGVGEDSARDVAWKADGTIVANSMGVSKITQDVAFGDFTKSTQYGILTMTPTIPAGSFFIGTRVNVTTAFDGGTNNLVVGKTSGEDEFSDGTTIALGSIALVGDSGEDPCEFLAAATTVYLRIDEGTDWDDVTAGAATIDLYFIKAGDATFPNERAGRVLAGSQSTIGPLMDMSS